jgi:ribosomal-protein-alanine N-acetyltransferase
MSTEMTRQTKISVRLMGRCHMDDVLCIENRCFEYPWSIREFSISLKNRDTYGYVAECGVSIAGYMIIQLRQTRIDLWSMAVAPEFHRQGVGRQMVEKLIGKLHPDRRSTINAMVRETNLPAQLFFKAMGFRWIGTWPGYYEESDEAAYQMRYYTPTPAEGDAREHGTDLANR